MSEELTAQEIFDTVARHLIKQGCRSHNQDECLYRGPDGLKCAVGALISDDEYDGDMELAGGVSCLADEGLLPDRLAGHVQLLAGLQIAHDGADDRSFAKSIRMRLRETARNFGLSATVLDEATSGAGQ